ncbi:co-chaperone GrpE [Pseudoflavonifractor capillosus ATCC 29799]|uniref:Protein GrpE n=1 Tax=Pseudoflavonifractor capillosus ATCC 29799 TaxID=411467 RepID=A6NX45_9FIRM|nr:nucleotide exchange factor GrpE [Pseudoflavonifractor capillosus]EDM99393.1 co-chaperone GrpE [Pseudoflavonifractor capillosus ATCC 29799]SCJ39624.1 HSP-70 cofactor [uncultured Flavonifractor sp.]
MSKKDKEKESVSQQETTQAPQEEAVSQAGTAQAPDSAELTAALESAEKAMAALKEKEDQFLRLAAEYDNYRRRSQKEKESVWNDAKSETVLAFLPVYDNLERALKQETADEAFKKGVEMTMNQLREVLKKLGVEEIPALGETFDPNVHNAVMHVEDESAGENTVVEVFQTGFKSGDKVVRFAMVKVAN